MYNQNQKIAYLGTVNDDTKNDITALFEKLEAVEEKGGMDLCDMDPRSYPSMIENITSAKFHRFYQLFSYMMSYRNYCKIMGYTTPGEYDRWKVNGPIAIDELYEVYTKIHGKNDFPVFDQKMLAMQLSKVYQNMPNTKVSSALPLFFKMEEIVMIFVMMINCGIKQEDIAKFKRTDIQFDSSTRAHIEYQGRRIQLKPEKLVNMLKRLTLCDTVHVGRSYCKHIQADYLMAFDVPEEMYSKIANKYRLDQGKTR